MEISTLFQATTEGGGEDFHQDQVDYARCFALNDPDILKAIFSYLDTPSVKVARLVCKTWEDAGSSILGKRCVLPLNHIFDTITYEPTPVNLKLLQRIWIPSSSVRDIDGDQVPAHVWTLCFMSFASKWNSFVQEMDISMEDDIHVTLPVTLKAFQFTNLMKIVIFKPEGIDTDFSLPVRCINSLKELKFKGDTFIESCSYPLLQNLINSAPNLECLDIDGNFFPNLATCRKLRVLQWSEGLGTNDELKVVKLDEVFRRIIEGDNHLEHLSLEFVTWEEFNNRFPKLPNLKSLTLDYCALFELSEWICPKLLPKLEMVSFNNQSHYDDFLGTRTGSFDQGRLAHIGVTSLKLLSLDRAERIRMASKKFPNVKRLVIGIDGAEEEGKTEAEFVGAFFHACSNWKLLHVEVEICRNFQLSQFLRGLRSLSLLEGVKEVKIVSHSQFLTDGVDDELQEFQEVFQLSAKMSKMSFKGLKLQPKENVLKFLSERKDLPIVYMD